MADKFPNAPLREGPARIGEPQISPSAEAARKMEELIHDQLLDTNATNVLRHAIFEACLMGTGIVKGPLNYNKQIHLDNIQDQLQGIAD